MFENGYYIRARHWFAQSPVTAGLLIANAIVFLLQKTIPPHFLPQGYLALSVEGLRLHFYWQLVTFQFLHGGWLHLILNCWALYVFGQHVERALGKGRYSILYFLSGIFGGLLHVLAASVWPGYFDYPVVGASAGVFGVVSAFAILWPQQPLRMILFFILPVNMRARSLLLVNLVLTGLGIAFPKSFFGGNIAHVAHLGGILAGLALVRWYERKLPPRFA